MKKHATKSKSGLSKKTFQFTTMTTLLGRLNRFEFEPVKSACHRCRQDYQQIVADAQSRTREYFNGLCLDCADRTKAVTEDDDMDYWRATMIWRKMTG